MKTCKKSTYSSKKEAENHLFIIIRKSTRKKAPIRAYLCAFCGKWHLTSKKDINSLEQEIMALKQEIDNLKSRLSIITSISEREIKVLAKKDKLVSQYKLQIDSAHKTIKRIRKDNEMLIMENNKLKNAGK